MAAEIGAERLARGDNAYGAAIGTAFAQMVTDPRTLARRGVPAGGQQRMTYTPDAARLWCREDGSVKRPGDHWTNPSLADTLEHLVRAGTRDFYVGELRVLNLVKPLVPESAHSYVLLASAMHEAFDGTTHVSTYDTDGNAVALTHTLGIFSGVMVPGTGVALNSGMDLFDPVPGGPNSIQPGKLRVSGMAPTIVFDGTRPIIVSGAPSTNAIVTSVLQVIVGPVDGKLSPVEAVSAPRVHCLRPAPHARQLRTWLRSQPGHHRRRRRPLSSRFGPTPPRRHRRVWLTPVAPIWRSLTTKLPGATIHPHKAMLRVVALRPREV
jgi:gamma-glutamyltranspeptidase